MTDTQLRTEAAAEPPRAPEQPLPRLGPWGALRFGWTQLTSMRTALVLLFALALAAIPGSLVPQRSVSPIRVSDFLVEHPTLGPLYDRLGLFHVYTSAWFSAVYLLLFVSLVGCIIPRVGVYARALRARPPRTPRHLARLPAYASRPLAEVAGQDEALRQRAAQSLRRRRYRVDVRDDGSVAAERGYLREAGNLVFHVSLLAVLLGVAIGTLYGFRGSTIVVVGQGFANTLSQYDDLSAGARFSERDLEPFALQVDDFDAEFETGPVQRGAARVFRAVLDVTDAPGDTPRTEVLEVNKPLDVDGTTVHLIGHGYAPRVTVRDGNGDVAFSGPVVFLPQDGNFTSAGAIKALDARPQQIGFQGFFLPTAVVSEDNPAPTSGFPDALNPVLFVNAYVGPPRTETGIPESVYSLDTTGMTEVKNTDGTPFRIALRVGATVDLPDDQGSITLDGWDRWVKLQVGDAPGMPLALGAIAVAVAGLCLSLFIRPRRVWLRVVRGADGGRLEVGGLDRADARAGLAEDVDELADELAGAPSPDGETTGTAAAAASPASEQAESSTTAGPDEPQGTDPTRRTEKDRA